MDNLFYLWINKKRSVLAKIIDVPPIGHIKGMEETRIYEARGGRRRSRSGPGFNENVARRYERGGRKIEE